MKECCKTGNEKPRSNYQKYRMYFIYIVLSAILLFVITTGFVKHGEETPHGGIIAHVQNGYAIEKVKGIKRMYFYLLYDDENTTITDENLKGNVEFTLNDGKKENYELTLSKDLQALKIIFTEKKKIKSTRVLINYKKMNFKTIYK